MRVEGRDAGLRKINNFSPSQGRRGIVFQKAEKGWLALPEGDARPGPASVSWTGNDSQILPQAVEIAQNGLANPPACGCERRIDWASSVLVERRRLSPRVARSSGWPSSAAPSGSRNGCTHLRAQRLRRGRVDRERVGYSVAGGDDAIDRSRALGRDPSLAQVVQHALRLALERMAVAAAASRMRDDEFTGPERHAIAGGGARSATRRARAFALRPLRHGRPHARPSRC